MKKSTKRILAGLLSVAMMSGTAAMAEEAIKVTLNGNPIYFDEQPVIRNERTLVPIRAIFEAMGMAVSWDEGTKKILAVGDCGVITMEIGTVMLGYGSSAENIELHTMDVPPCIINDRTYVPARFVAEATGYNVDWDSSTRTVVISGEARQPEKQASINDTFEVKGSLEFYGNTIDVVDYGKLNNTECSSAAEEDEYFVYRYQTTANDLVNYTGAIKAQGYEFEDSWTLFDLSMLEYVNGDRVINLTYDKSEKSVSVSISKNALK